MKLLNWLRRDRVAEALHPSRERLLPFDARQVVRSYCEPIPCDIEDNYVCAAHRNG